MSPLAGTGQGSCLEASRLSDSAGDVEAGRKRGRLEEVPDAATPNELPSGPGPPFQDRVQSMGWLTESAVLPKKGRAIEGVGASSLVELRAQLYRSQEDSRRASAGEPVTHKRQKDKEKDRDAFSRANSGVEERVKRDMLQLKSEQDGSLVRQALERKAELYEKIRRGDLPDEEEGERYSVDFLRKGTLEEESQEMEAERGEQTVKQKGLAREEAQAHVPGSAAHKDLIREVNQETLAAREQASALKQQRDLQARRRQEKLRAAFAKKQAEKMLKLCPKP